MRFQLFPERLEKMKLVCEQGFKLKPPKKQQFSSLQFMHQVTPSSKMLKFSSMAANLRHPQIWKLLGSSQRCFLPIFRAIGAKKLAGRLYNSNPSNNAGLELLIPV